MAGYSADDIQTLEFPYSVQKRTGMYLGNSAKNETSPGMKNVCVREITDNSITEAMKGYADEVTLTFHKDGFVSCLDNGRGIPTSIDANGVNGIIKCLATLHSGGNFNNDPGKVGPGLNGVGASAVNAVSSRFDVSVFKKNRRYYLSFQDGISGHFDSSDQSEYSKFTESEKIKSEQYEHEQGTLIRFKLNDQYFSDVENIIVDDIIDRMRYTVYLIPGLTIKIIDETRTGEEGGGEYVFTNEGDIPGMMDFISSGDTILTSKDDSYTSKGIFQISTKAKYKDKYVDTSSGKSVVKERNNVIPIEVAIRFNEDEDSNVLSFANTIRTHQGGVHENALKNALADTFVKMAKKNS